MIQSIVANQVISLSVLTTSYFRHVVSTVQSSVNNANNGTVLNRRRWRLTFHSFHIHNSIPLRMVSIFLFSQIHSQTHFAIRNQDLYLASDRNHSTSTES